MEQQGRGLMSQAEARRLVVLQGVKGEMLSQAQAAQQLDLSVRQVSTPPRSCAARSPRAPTSPA